MFNVKPALRLLINLILFIVVQHINAESDINDLTPCEVEQIVRQILSPDERYKLHANAIQSQLKALVKNSQNADYENVGDQQSQYNDFEYSDDAFDEEKRSLSTLARNGDLRSNNQLPNSNKRNIGSVARLGTLRLGNPDEVKRSIAALAKNGQLPSREPEVDEITEAQLRGYKRNIGSLARGGGINAGKRNIAALAKNYELPPYGKRNLPSILRSSGQPKTNDQQPPKRGISYTLPFYHHENRNEKREVHESDYGKKISKREINYSDYPTDKELLESMYQAEPINDYDLYRDSVDDFYSNYGKDIHDQKRYLGSIMKGKWSANSFQPIGEKRNIGSLARQGLLRNDVNSLINLNSYRQREDKRYLGSIARTGWRPGFRSIRNGQFSRSGRARSRFDESYLRRGQHLQPIAGACERCKLSHGNPIGWTNNDFLYWGGSSRIPAIQQRSFRGPFHPSANYL